MHNHYYSGGPLIRFVPEQPVFIDGRQHPYPASFVVKHFEIEDSGNYRPLFERYGIRCAVLPPDPQASGRGARARRLAGHVQGRLVDRRCAAGAPTPRAPK